MTPHPAARRATVGLTAALLTFGAAACSSGDDRPSASSLVTDAHDAASAAKSTRVDISGDVKGTETTMTVAGVMDGSNQQQIRTQGAGRSEGLVIGNQAYLKGNSTFWQALGAPADTASKLNDKWWKGSPISAASNPKIDVKKLLDGFFGADEGKRLASKDATIEKTTTNGVETYTLSDPRAADHAKLSVERGGDHRVVRIDDYSSPLTNTKASYLFTHWNEVKPFTAPANAPEISSVL